VLDVVGAVLHRRGIQRAAGEDVAGHESLDFPLGPDPAMEVHELQPEIPLHAPVQPVEVGLVAGAGGILEELHVRDAREADAVVSATLC